MLDYKDFYEKIKKFKEIQEQQKQRGLNDFNLLTVVRKYHDEVYLHSAMIGALLSPHGLHYQKTLFLELFLKEIGLNEWGLTLENVSVHVEYKDIDLYITDGVKHIIIENKIWADDQDCQIIKYINIIIEENQETFKNPEHDSIINDEFLRVIYLTAQSKEVPDEHEVNDDEYISFCGGKEKLKECSKKDHTKALVPNDLKNYKVRYQKNTYKDILQWLENSKKQVSNITNLNEAMQQYMDVVEMVNNTYKGKVMSLKEYIEKENDLDFGLLKSVVSDYKDMIQKSKNEFLSSLGSNLKNLCSNSYKENHIKLSLTDEIILQTGIENDKVFISIYKKDWQIIKDKNIVLNKLKNITVNGKKLEDPTKWKNVYATIDIIDVESKEFLEIDKNVTTVLEAIKEIKEILE